MRIWDSELLAAKKLSPVTDGLIFWLDGQDTLYGDTRLGSYEPPVWKNAHMFDRVSGIRVDFKQSYGNTRGVRQEGSFICSLVPTASGSDEFKAETENEIRNIATVEIVSDDCVRVFSGNLVPVTNAMYYPYNVSPVLSVDFSDLSRNFDQVVGTLLDARNKPPALYQNGIMIKSLASNSTGKKHSTKRAVYFNGYGAETHYFGSVRFYNRLLTQEEILQNLEYEKSIGRVVL